MLDSWNGWVFLAVVTFDAFISGCLSQGELKGKKAKGAVPNLHLGSPITPLLPHLAGTYHTCGREAKRIVSGILGKPPWGKRAKTTAANIRQQGRRR